MLAFAAARLVGVGTIGIWVYGFTEARRLDQRTILWWDLPFPIPAEFAVVVVCRLTF